MKKKVLGRKWLRRLALMAGVVVLLAASAMWVKYITVPAYVRSRVSQAFVHYWSGSVELKNVDFNFFGDTEFDGLTFLDEEGRIWAVGSGSVSLGQWNGLEPQVKSITLENLQLNAHVIDGKCSIPIKLPADDEKPIEFPSLERVSVSGVVMDIINHDLGGKKQTLAGMAQVEFSPNEKPSCTGVMKLENLKLSAIVGLLDASVKIPSGLVNGSFSFWADGISPLTLRGRGGISITDADLNSFAPYAKLLESRVISPDLAGHCKINAEFTLDYPIINLSKADIANKMMTIAVEPNGKINLQDGTVDLYLVDGLIEELARISPTGNILAIMTRYHVKGKLTDSADKLVKKETMKDISDGALTFFLQTAGLPMQLGRKTSSVIGVFMDAFNRKMEKNRQNAKTQPSTSPASQPDGNGSS